MKVLSAAEMREVDRRTIELGIPGLILMENAGVRVVEFLLQRFAPLREHRIAVVCGKGNNGGDGFVIARQLYTRDLAGSLDVFFPANPEELKGDAAANYRMLAACGCPVVRELSAGSGEPTLVIDAVLGTGLSGPATGPALDAIAWIDRLRRSGAVVVSVDLPSGLSSDGGHPPGEHVVADHTVTFTSLKPVHVLPPGCDACGEVLVVPIGSPEELYEGNASIWLAQADRADFFHLFTPREPGSHKGDFGHVLVVGGSRGKTGAAAMTGLAALRAGAGLVTVASAESAIPVIAAHAAELMTEPLPETESGGISLRAFDYGRFEAVAGRKTILALGPGLGTHPDTIAFVRRVFREAAQPVVIDADGLNALAGLEDWTAAGRRILTPHPGETARLTGRSTAEIQADRVGAARSFATRNKVSVVLKGQRTLTAFPDGRVIVNPTGTPALATGGSGDILTGLVAGLMGQFPGLADDAIVASVWLHGRAAEIGVKELGEKSLIATDLLQYLPEAMEECADLDDIL